MLWRIFLETAAIAAFLYALGFAGDNDRRSAEVSHQIAVDAQRPIFEPLVAAPCTWIQQDGGPTPSRTACVDTDLRKEPE